MVDVLIIQFTLVKNPRITPINEKARPKERSFMQKSLFRGLSVISTSAERLEDASDSRNGKRQNFKPRKQEAKFQNLKTNSAILR